MNTSLIKSALAMTAAFAVGSALATETQIYGATFEQVKNEPINDQTYMPGPIAGCNNNGAGWFAESADDQSVITANGGYGNSQALQLQTEGGTLTNEFSSTVKTEINDARENATLRFEAKVKFVASDTLECGVEPEQDAKFALYAYTPEDGSKTNLVIFHRYYDEGLDRSVYTNQVIPNINITEELMPVVVDYKMYLGEACFSVTVDDVPATNAVPCDAGAEWFLTINADALGSISSLCFKGTGMVDDIAIKSVEEAQQSGWVDDSTTVSNQTAAAAYQALENSALANANAGKLTDWAKANSVEFSAVTAAPADYVDAFLLNCAATPAAVAQEKAEFVLDITIDENGVPVITLPEGKTYNGTIQLKGAATLTGGWTDISAPSAAYNFYKCELHL